MIDFPRKVVPGAVAARRRFETELAPTESLLGRWSRYCFEYHPDEDELRQMFVPFSAGKAILTLPPGEKPWQAAPQGQSTVPRDSHERAAAIVGLSPEATYTASSLNLCSPRARRAATCGFVRACWHCLGLGFHSVLFQHYALRRCPLHGTELTTQCPRCHACTRPTFDSVAGAPFSCEQCGELWLRTVKPAYGDEYLRLAGAMLADRMKDLFRVDAAVGDENRVLDQADARPLLAATCDTNSAAHGRQVARWTAWPSLPSTRWPSFCEQRLLLFDWMPSPEGAWPEGGPFTSHDATQCLRMLARMCAAAGHAHDGLRLTERLSMSPRGLRLNDRASAVAVALHLTMCTYGRRAPEARQQARAHGAGYYYEDVEWNGAQVGRRLLRSDLGNAQLIVAEILGCFSAAIVDVSSMLYLRNVDWRQTLPETLFLPAWVVTRSGSHHVLRIRSRASERRVQRLLGRYPPEATLDECADWGDSFKVRFPMLQRRWTQRQELSMAAHQSDARQK